MENKIIPIRGQKIAYGLASVGRGHTTRAIGIAEKLLEAGHEVRFFTRHEAMHLLRKRFGSERVVPMLTPRFVYGDHGLEPVQTTVANARFLTDRDELATRVTDQIGEWGADAVISDFEPLMWSASQQLDLPFISFNSQHFAVACRVRDEIPWWKTWRLLPIKMLSRFFAPSANLYVISKPFALPTRKDDMHLVGPVIRPSIENSKWKPSGTHITAYLREAIGDAYSDLARLAEETGLELRIYGVEPDARLGDAVYRPISEEGFVKDLTTADLVVSTAGSQLIGEVAFLGVPTLLVPEPGQAEQRINAQLADVCYPRITWSKAHHCDELDANELLGLRSKKHRPIKNGTVQASELILQFLENQMVLKQHQKVNPLRRHGIHRAKAS